MGHGLPSNESTNGATPYQSQAGRVGGVCSEGQDGCNVKGMLRHRYPLPSFAFRNHEYLNDLQIYV